MSVINVEPAPSAPRALAPPASAAFANCPAGWFVFATSDELSRGPLTRTVFGRRIVGFRTSDGRPIALDAQCWHMGADLGEGDIVDGCIRCPFHGWRFGPGGRCAHVPTENPPPHAARQRAFAAGEIAGRVLVFPFERPTHPLPFFEGVDPAELLTAAPFEFRVRCPWWLVGTNGFDLQHFLGAHDRHLVSEPTIHTPHPAARRIVATFDVSGRSWRDRLTRWFSGPRVTMDVTVWAGSLVFVQARFRRRTSYGMVEIHPDSTAGGDEPVIRVRITIFIRRRTGIHRALDPVDVRIRRTFIRAFLEPDARLLDGARYRPDRLIHADHILAEYLAWLAPVSHGNLGIEEPQ